MHSSYFEHLKFKSKLILIKFDLIYFFYLYKVNLFWFKHEPTILVQLIFPLKFDRITPFIHLYVYGWSFVLMSHIHVVSRLKHFIVSQPKHDE